RHCCTLFGVPDIASVRIISFLKTTTFRLALLYAGLFCVSFIGIFAAVYWTTDVLATRERQRVIRADVESLREIYEQNGVGALGAALLERTSPGRVGDSIYILATPDFKPIAGNGTNWPTPAESEGRWMTFAIDRSEFGDTEPHRAQALHITLLPGGYNLLVGRDMRAQERFQEALASAFFAALAVIIALGVVEGLVMSRAILGRIEAINQAAERIMRGGVKHRMPVRGRNDEFDRLSENLNRMLDEIERLL